MFYQRKPTDIFCENFEREKCSVIEEKLPSNALRFVGFLATFRDKKMVKDINSALLPNQSDVVALDTKTKH